MADPSIERFRAVISVAYAHLEERRQEINDLNVFPVADGDTGDNMALTLRHVIDELDRLEQASAGGDPKRPEIVRAVARAALMGARGNSGVILSQIVRGAAEKLATPPGRLIDPEMIEAALANASDAAWASVREPAEGTMLTVARAMAEAVAERRANWNTHRLDTDATADEQNALLAEMLAAALFAGEEAVRHTPEQLKVLADAGVVDAGALGLVVIVRGALAALAGESVTLPEIEHFAPARLSDVHHAESQYRYCINFIVLGEGLSTSAQIPQLEEVGDSVLVVGDEATLKVHVHADDPEDVRSIFDGVGTIEREDIADMHEQIAEREARLGDTRTGVVAVASGPGMLRLFSELGAHVIDGGPTMNPSTKDLLRGIEAAGTEEIVLMPNSKNVHMAAEEAARLSEREVRVVSSLSQQGGLAALIEHDPSAPAEENAGRLSEALDHIRVGGVAPAAKDDVEGRFVRGDTVGFEGDEVVAWGGTGSTLAATVTRLAEGAEIVTVIEGEMPPIELSELNLALPDDVELEVHRGGQPSWYWLIAAQ
ncbi:MAG TPA: DAK2 domain-containing protein [Solirubrobacterales bacterium]|nr:DAK2 domain-containing protein [Solirubrobacterales bacterium]